MFHFFIEKYCISLPKKYKDKENEKSNRFNNIFCLPISKFYFKICYIYKMTDIKILNKNGIHQMSPLYIYIYVCIYTVL